MARERRIRRWVSRTGSTPNCQGARKSTRTSGYCPCWPALGKASIVCRDCSFVLFSRVFVFRRTNVGTFLVLFLCCMVGGTQFVHGRSRMTIVVCGMWYVVCGMWYDPRTLQYRGGARRVFADQADKACTKREAP